MCCMFVLVFIMLLLKLLSSAPADVAKTWTLSCFASSHQSVRQCWGRVLHVDKSMF